MKKKHGAFFGMTVLILAAALIPAGCGKKGQGDLLLLLNGGGSPIVTSVTVTPGSAIVLGGGTKAFSALVEGINNPAQTVAWTVSGNVKTETVISSGGVLSIHLDEPDGTPLTITATSTVDTSKSGTAMVRVGYIVGDVGPASGIIFYVDSADTYPGWKYLEAAPEDIPGDIAWASSPFIYTSIGGTFVTIGKGKENTEAILAKDENAPAAKACADYGNSTAFDDWFLPSLDDLEEMYDNKETIGGFDTDVLITYWSSSEDSATEAWRRMFSSDDPPIKCGKNATGWLRVRPIRRF
jgi:hypothetical protein